MRISEGVIFSAARRKNLRVFLVLAIFFFSFFKLFMADISAFSTSVNLNR